VGDTRHRQGSSGFPPVLESCYADFETSETLGLWEIPNMTHP